MSIDTGRLHWYYTPVRLRMGGVRVPLSELAAPERIAGVNSVTRKLKAGSVGKIFLAKDADPHLLQKLIELADRCGTAIEWVDESKQLGRACAVMRKTAAAALLKK